MAKYTVDSSGNLIPLSESGLEEVTEDDEVDDEDDEQEESEEEDDADSEETDNSDGDMSNDDEENDKWLFNPNWGEPSEEEEAEIDDFLFNPDYDPTKSWKKKKKKLKITRKGRSQLPPGSQLGGIR